MLFLFNKLRPETKNNNNYCTHKYVALPNFKGLTATNEPKSAGKGLLKGILG